MYYRVILFYFFFAINISIFKIVQFETFEMLSFLSPYLWKQSVNWLKNIDDVFRVRDVSECGPLICICHRHEHATRSLQRMRLGAVRSLRHYIYIGPIETGRLFGRWGHWPATHSQRNKQRKCYSVCSWNLHCCLGNDEDATKSVWGGDIYISFCRTNRYAIGS